MIAAAPRALGLLLLVCLLSAPAVAAKKEEPGLPILESGMAAVDLGNRRLTVRYSTTVAGPLVEARPLIAALGGELEIGPLGESHELTLNEQTFAFGPRSDALTSGAEIIDLSQAAIGTGETGVQVPLDLLDRIYGHQLGYEFTWNPAARLLLVRHQPSRELGMQFNLVHVQGVTTVVLQFSTRPRYRIRDSITSVTVELIGDRLRGDTARTLPTDDMVRGIEVARNGIRLRLAPGTKVENYVLDDPYRLVFDVFRDARARARMPVAPEGPQRRRSERIRTIVLDPGHGGADTGAVGASGLEEKRLVLQLARATQRLLEERLPVRVVLTRTTDAEVPLPSRAAFANQNKGDLFVSLHLNSAVGGGARGAETFYLSADTVQTAAIAGADAEEGDPLFDLKLLHWDLAQTPHLAGSRALAELIQEELDAGFDLRRRSVKRAPLRVLMGVAMPAVLVELGFLSHREEEEKLSDPAYRLELADALVKAIGRYRAQVEGSGDAIEEAAP